MKARMLEVSQRVSGALTPGDLLHTLRQITSAAVQALPDVRYASISVRHADGRLETVAPTDPVVTDLDHVQYSLQEGPCYESATETQHTTAPDLRADPRYARRAPRAIEAGVLAQAGIRLFDAQDSNGALNLYASEAGAFTDLGGLDELFVRHAATAIEYARQIDNLTVAMQSRQMVGQAVGIVMERFRLDEARAFAFLTRVSAQAEIKVREVARRLIEQTSNPDR